MKAVYEFAPTLDNLTEFLGVTKLPLWFKNTILAAVIMISWGSEPASGMHRYVLTAPAVFVALAMWGRNPVFDRVGTIIAVLWMGDLAALFALNLWVA